MAAAKSKKYRSSFTPAAGLRLLLLSVLSILLQYVDHRDDPLDTLRKAISATVYPLRVIVDAPVSAWRWLDAATTSRKNLQLENNRFRTESLLAQTRLQRYAALEAENARLRTMLEARLRVHVQARVAEIMSVSANPFRQVIVIDKGTTDNVFAGQALIDADGVVGQVIEAGFVSSQCLLISDPGHDLPVEVNRNGLRTIARGTGEYDLLYLPFLPNNADIEQGDLLVTSGLGGIFPAGYPVAIVETVTRLPQEPFASVTARPLASLNQVREVMLIWTENEEIPVDVEDSATDDRPPVEQTGEDDGPASNVPLATAETPGDGAHPPASTVSEEQGWNGE